VAPRLAAEARALLKRIGLPLKVYGLLRDPATSGDAQSAIEASARRRNLSTSDVRRLLDLLATVGDPFLDDALLDSRDASVDAQRAQLAARARRALDE
jgi:hypothetical protein